jgi:hypothetical protein
VRAFTIFTLSKLNSFKNPAAVAAKRPSVNGFTSGPCVSTPKEEREELCPVMKLVGLCGKESNRKKIERNKRKEKKIFSLLHKFHSHLSIDLKLTDQ